MGARAIKMMLNFRLKLIVLLVVVISNVHFKCQALVSSSSQQQHRQIGDQGGKNSSNVERITAILSAKPRPNSSTQSALQHQQQQQQQQQPPSKAEKADQIVKLHSVASNSDSRTVVKPTDSTVVNKSLPVAKNQGKRQAGDFADQPQPSRRNEDPWFLDQAPLPLQPYRFVYNVKDKNGLTEQYRQETGDGKFLTGSYGYVLPDGIFRHVDYVADDRGFRAFIRTSEPGTANQNPADVVINSSPVLGASYANPATISSTIGSQSPQQSWTDQQQPRAAWNYTTLGPGPVSGQFEPLSERFRSTLDTTGILPRRAPGSIVGTPLRNFSSFTYPLTPSSQLDISSPPPSSSAYLRSQDSPNTGSNNLQSLSHFGDLTRLRPIGGGESPSSGNLTNFNTLGGGGQFGTHTSDTKSDRERDRFSGGLQNRFSSSAFQDGTRYGTGQDRPSLFAQAPYYQRPGLLLPSRVGPDVLLYDRPFGVQQVDGGVGSSKLNYDYNLIVSRDPEPYMAEDRAKNLAYLDRLKALSHNVVRPDVTPHELGALTLLSHLTNRQPFGQSAQTGTVGEASTKTTSSSHSEHHHEHKSTSHVDDASKMTLTREHKSGSTSGLGHVSGTSFHQPAGERILPPPPQPDFGGQQRWATKGQQQQHLARLLAPYADEHQFSRKAGVKGGQEPAQQFIDDNIRYSQPATSSPRPPEEPRAPTEPSPPNDETEQTKSLGGASSMTGTTIPADEIDLNQATASKSASQTTRPSSHEHHQARSIRMPEDYRTSMLMNDLRSMQNALGLPQPPRLQRSSSVDGEQRAPSAAGSAANLAEQIVLARMGRVEALLGGDGNSNPSVAPQQASVQVQSVAVRTDKHEPGDPRLQDGGINKLREKSKLLAAGGGNQPADNEVDDDQPRRLSTGPVLKQASGSSGQSNETSMFEAQRLSNNRARLRAEKVSELEKFQQRLRTQQLMLEQVKSSDSKANNGAPKQPKASGVSHRMNEANSHVKYDEPQENELSQSGSKDEELAHSRRQNDIEMTANRTTAIGIASNSSQIAGTPRAPATSDFARQIHQWPSVARQQAASANSSGINSSDSTDSGPVAFKAHKMNPSKQDTRQTEPASNNKNNDTQRGAPNTINLDFINSVTALSMDHLNPFAISSVNPAIQRTTNSERLTPHRLTMPLAGVQQQQQQQDHQSTGGANLLATAPARYFSSPELLAAVNHHERYDTSQRMRSLLNLDQNGPANHRTGPNSGGSNINNAPYMMHPQEHAVTSRSLEGILGAKFIVTPATSPTSLMSEAANSQHKTIVPTPRPPADFGLRQTRNHSQATLATIQRDGFEIRDRAVHVDNHRFYEVVSSLKQPTELTASFQAFRDAQLSIPANSRR